VVCLLTEIFLPILGNIELKVIGGRPTTNTYKAFHYENNPVYFFRTSLQTVVIIMIGIALHITVKRLVDASSSMG
jgi:hypothetical protein